MLSVDVQPHLVGQPGQVNDAVGGGAGVHCDLREEDARHQHQHEGDQCQRGANDSCP